MVDTDRSGALAAECRTFTHYLVGRDADADVLAAYQDAHSVSVVEASGAAPSHDRALLTIARFGPRCARTADSYASVFARASLLRRKLVLLVAILESRGTTASLLDTAEPGSRVLWLVSLCARVGVFALVLSLAVLLIAPLRLWYRLGR